ncbi:MAG: hypothetical protein WAM30_16355 [Candidatus Dormiibacterota bacterium]
MTDAAPETPAETERAAERCSVCEAPALPVAGACVFCATPLVERGEPDGLLDYIAGRLPGAVGSRSGLLHRGPVQRLEVRIGDAAFQLELKKDGLELLPAEPPEDWVGDLVQALTAAAEGDVDRRAALSRTGWAWR